MMEEEEEEKREEEEVSPIPEIDFGELMKLYENLPKDKVHSGWSSFKIEFIGMTAYVVELYVNDTIPLYIFKRFIKMINRVKQFNQVLEEKVKKREKNDTFPYLLNVEEEELKHVALSHRGEILQQWTHFSCVLVAFERVLEERIGDDKLRDATWKAYMLLMDEATYFESELSSYLLTTTKLSKPTLFMHAEYVKGGFEEAEEKDDFSTRIKSLKMSETRMERLKKENQARKESKKVKTEEKTEEEKREGVLKRRKKLKLVIPKKKIKSFDYVADEIAMRDAEIKRHQELLTTFFMESLAVEIDKKIQYLAESDCSGCAAMSLTQNDHDVCLMMSSPEKFELYFSKAVNLVAFVSVFKEWDDRVQKVFTPPLSKGEMEEYEIADNPLERFNTVKGSPEELDKLKNYVKSIYPSYRWTRWR